MAKTKNEQQPHSFKRKLGNTTYTVKVHFSKDTDKTFKDRVQKLIINECLKKIKNNPHQHFTPLIRRRAAMCPMWSEPFAYGHAPPRFEILLNVAFSRSE